MNERITQLAEEATYKMEFGGDVLQTSNGEVSYEIPAGFIEAFAKLLITECIGLTLDHKNNDYYNGWLDFRDLVKEHFGVEE